MSRKLVSTLTAIIALNGFIVGSTLWPSTARSTGSEASDPKGSIHRPLTDVAPAPQRQYVPAFLTMIDFEREFAGANALPHRQYVPVALTTVEFDQAFDSVTAARRGNTPPNREKLRNAGWKRILGAG